MEPFIVLLVVGLIVLTAGKIAYDKGYEDGFKEGLRQGLINWRATPPSGETGRDTYDSCRPGE